MSRIHVTVLLGLFCLFSSLNSWAQSADLVLKVADDLFDNKDYYGSISFYQKAMEIDSNNAEVLYKYARNLSLTNQHEKSSRYYQKALLLDGGQNYPMAAYYLAESYRYSSDYRKARRYYNQALRPYRSDRDSYWYQRIDQNKDAAAWANRNDQIVGNEPANLTKKVNSNSSEFGPFIHAKKLYYSALIADSSGENFLINDKEYLTRIYWKSLTTEDPAVQLELSENLNKKFKELHLANPAFYKNDMYFSVCDSNFKCTIWKGQVNSNKLVEAVQLNKNINHPTSNNTQASPVSFDDHVYLFFVSDRTGGQGDLDIWMAKEESFGFDEALNLGPNINTLGNEITPFYDAPSQTLFFSSDWHIGFGGYDVFKSEGKPGSFGLPENLKIGINSSNNDYYFKSFSPIATFSSNRHIENVDKEASCCNDLYELSYQLDSIPNEATEVLVNIDVLNRYLPMELYFHNDQPDPNSRVTSTNKNYQNLATAYQKMETEYIESYLEVIDRKDKENRRAELESFFDEKLKRGVSDLNYFTPLLLQELQKGSQIELTIKGFASSISETEYNLNLTLRRVESLVNYFKAYKNGVFLPYLNGTSSDGGSLSFNKIPYGEYAVSSVIDESDRIAAVYSLQAANERKIELIAVSNSNKDSELSIEETPAIKFNSNKYELGSIPKGKVINRFFKVENSGKGNLKIYNINANCDCINVSYPKNLEAGDTGKILVEILTENLSGDVNIEILVVSNTDPNLNQLNISFSIGE